MHGALTHAHAWARAHTHTRTHTPTHTHTHTHTQVPGKFEYVPTTVGGDEDDDVECKIAPGSQSLLPKEVCVRRSVRVAVCGCA